MDRVERAQVTRGEGGSRTPDRRVEIDEEASIEEIFGVSLGVVLGTGDLDRSRHLDRRDHARREVRVGRDGPRQGGRLGLVDDELHERRRIGVQKPRSDRGGPR